MFIILTQCVLTFVQSGDIEIVNHRTRDTCQLKFSPYSYFSKDVPRKVNTSTLMPGAIMMSYITFLNLCDAATCWTETALECQNNEVEIIGFGVIPITLPKSVTHYCFVVQIYQGCKATAVLILMCNIKKE